MPAAKYFSEAQAPREHTSTNRQWTTDQVDACHRNLMATPSQLLHLLESRGLTIETIRRFKIGLFQRDLYMIPVFSDIGELMAVRYYANDKEHSKWGVKGVSSKMLYPWLGMNGANPLWICEGEFDAMLATQNGMHVITTTSGATTAPHVFYDYRNVFGDQRRFVLAFDNDDHGYMAAVNIGLNVFRGRIEGIVKWPGRTDTEPGFQKDLSDWFNGGRCVPELEACVVNFDEDWAEQFRVAYKKKWNTGPSGDSLKNWHADPSNEAALMVLMAALGQDDVPMLFASGATLFSGVGNGTGGASVPAEAVAVDADKASPTLMPDGFDVSTMYPDTGFIRDFITYVSETTDAPDQLHVGTALTFLGVATERKVFYQLGVNRIYPNFFTALIAPSSRFRKSTSIKNGLEILMQHRASLILPKDFSTESFLLYLAKTASKGVFCFSELAELLDQFKRGYSEGTLALLTDFYDCPARYVRRTQKDGDQTIENIFLSIIGASTVDWLNKNLSADHSEGGFWPRFLFFPARVRTKPIIELPPPPDTYKRDCLVYQMKEIEAVSGQMVLSEAASKTYRAWARKIDHQADKHLLGPGFVKYLSRMQPYALKIAMLYELTESRCLEVSQIAMERTLTLVDWLIVELEFLHRNEIAPDKTIAKEQSLVRIVRANPGITKRDAMRSLNLPSKQFDSLSASLIEKEYLSVALVKGKSGRMVPCLFLPSSD